MWPWDHVAFAYVLYAGYAHARGQRTGTVLAVAVVTAALTPDLIDKPLAWGLHVLPSGRSLGHSAFTAAAVTALTGVVGRRIDERGLAGAVGIGYGSHLIGDIVYPLIVNGDLPIGFLLWPLIPADPAGSPEAVGHVWELVGDFLAYLSTPTGAAYLFADALLLVAALRLWIADGMPGIDLLRSLAVYTRR